MTPESLLVWIIVGLLFLAMLTIAILTGFMMFLIVDFIREGF